MDFEIEIESATSHEDIRNKGKAPARMSKVYRSNARRSCCHVCHVRHVTDHVVSTWHRSTNHRRDRHQQNLAHAKRGSHIFASKPAAASKLTEMNAFAFALLVLLVSIDATLARPKEADPSKKRVHESETLSNLDHGVGENAEHDPDYDHEAFLGKDTAKTFDQLTPEESKERLR